MKKYRCPNSNRIVLGILWTVILIPLAILFGLGIVMLVFHSYNNILELIQIVLVCFGLPLLGIILFRKTLPEISAKLVLSDSQIVWKCFLYKPVTLYINECSCVGVKVFSNRLKGHTQKVLDKYGRGDEFAYIYISKFTIPDKYFKAIASTPCKKGFVKFLYSDTLCKDLVEILPKEKTYQLISFYNRMQAADRVNKLKQQNKKKRKSKKK